MRILGIDYGRARVGVALGDTETKLASPWDVIQRRNDAELIAALSDLAKQEGIEKFVVGVPRPLADQSRETGQAEEIHRFMQALRATGLPVEEENETMSTALAARYSQELGERGKRDDLAAVAILQTYLDRF